MTKVKIKILTKIHIGDGEKLTAGVDFIDFTDDEGSWVGIVDSRKIMSIIGNKPNAIDAWIAAIEKGGSIDSFMESYARHAYVDDYTSRIINNVVKIEPKAQLQTFIHNGFGMPYIPGSSLKGSIRTAIVSSLLQKEGKLRDIEKLSSFKGAEIEKKVLGNNPTNDLLRFLQVGDTYFEENAGCVVKLVHINERKKQEYQDKTKSILAEILPKGEEGTCDIKLNLQHYQQARSWLRSLPECLSSLNNLFETINQHTKQLLEKEITHWEEKKEEDATDCVEKYVEKMKDILEEIKICEMSKGKSCVTRIGAGSGWRFITGAWSESLSIFESKIIPKARPNHHRYEEYCFPKSRRVDILNVPLGFIKLTQE